MCNLAGGKLFWRGTNMRKCLLYIKEEEAMLRIQVILWIKNGVIYFSCQVI